MRKIENIFKKICELEDGFSFSRNELNNLLSPCIYIYLKNRKPIYVGCSQHGTSRALASHVTEEIQEEADKLIIYPVSNCVELENEEILISHFKPKYNKRIKLKQ